MQEYYTFMLMLMLSSFESFFYSRKTENELYKFVYIHERKQQTTRKKKN